ncbi:MAG TPA: PQQ-binding-like beta-propeller repeat protein [Planctomycetota bacterium]|nr:PQQ-binding-like beta-propeller repeat protein [Planctomycetota bacterium]
MRTFGAGVILMLLSALAGAQDWPQFRGPTGLGYTPEKNLPLTWGGEKGENIVWKSPLVGEGHASPIVWGDRVFLCTVRWPGGKQDPKIMPEHHVTCYGAADGKLAWDTTIEAGPWLRNDFRSGPGGGYAACTPATDGKRVYVVFASSVVAALDMDGKVAWRQEIKPFSFDVTIGGSPILQGDSVIFLCGMAKASDSRLVAWNKSDGAVRWETKLPKVSFAHSTPVLIPNQGKIQVVIVASGIGVSPEGVQGFDPADGKRIWWCRGAGDASSPAFASGLLYTDSGRGGSGTAMDPSGEGDLTGKIKWTVGGLSEAIGSPIIVGEQVFRLQSPGVLRIWNVSDGQETDKQRLAGVSSTWASPVADGEGRLYFASGGKSTVIQAGPQLKILAVNDLGDPNHASPAVSRGRIYIEGLKNLYCIAAK